MLGVDLNISALQIFSLPCNPQLDQATSADLWWDVEYSDHPLQHWKPQATIITSDSSMLQVWTSQTAKNIFKYLS